MAGREPPVETESIEAKIDAGAHRQNFTTEGADSEERVPRFQGLSGASIETRREGVRAAIALILIGIFGLTVLAGFVYICQGRQLGPLK